MQNKKSGNDVIIVGFALFAMFFGAGNLIFPPALGVMTGTDWVVGSIGFILADAGLGILPILAASKFEGNISKVFDRAGKTLSILIGSAGMICIGPLLAIPRTAATTFEMGVRPMFSGISAIIISVIFFVLTYMLTIRPSRVVDIIGKFLTPALLISLSILIIKGIISPLGEINTEPIIDGVFAQGVAYGYQTMDALAAMAVSAVVIGSLVDKGYTDTKAQVKITLKAGIVAALGLTVVYAGLTYLGSTVASQYVNATIDNTALLVAITEALFGQVGKIILAIAVSLACLTTSVGLTSATAQYFSSISNNKVKYETLIVGICVFSTVVSTFGVSTIIQLATPILEMVYPSIVVLSVMTLFGEKIKNDNSFKFATYMALFISALNVLNSFGFNISIVNKLPFAGFGFGWIVPVIIAAIVGAYVGKKSIDEDVEELV